MDEITSLMSLKMNATKAIMGGYQMEIDEYRANHLHKSYNILSKPYTHGKCSCIKAPLCVEMQN